MESQGKKYGFSRTLCSFLIFTAYFKSAYGWEIHHIWSFIFTCFCFWFTKGLERKQRLYLMQMFGRPKSYMIQHFTQILVKSNLSLVGCLPKFHATWLSLVQWWHFISMCLHLVSTYYSTYYCLPSMKKILTGVSYNLVSSYHMF